MPNSTPTCPRGHRSDHRIRRDGWVVTKKGRRQLFLCVGADGSKHRFRGDIEPAQVVGIDGRRRGDVELRCPRPGHRDGIIQSRGTRTTATGTWRRFVCSPPLGQRHTFSVLVAGDAPPALTRTSAPPSCPEHPGSRVLRDGTYGKRSSRQRYECRPEGGRPHHFTPPLSREAVAPGETCARCDELLSPHHGPVTAARHTPWPLLGVTQALNALSLGESYGNVSLTLRKMRDEAREHLADSHGIRAFTRSEVSPASETVSFTRRQRRNAWRVAADLVEQYAPPLFAEVDARFHSETQALRAHNDELLARDPKSPLSQPIIYILDEMPQWSAPKRGQRSRPAWQILTVVEVLWRETEDPFLLPERGTRLRLARAFPRNNADAWKLVLSELGVRPDFVVADAGSGLNTGVTSFYGASVGVVPSLWHIHANIRDALAKLDNASYVEGKEKVLTDPLRKHLSTLARSDLIGSTPKDIADWWDELIAIVASLPAPVSSIINLRATHEPRLIAALPILHANPHVPVSNAPVEVAIRNELKPFLINRAHRFANQERTNRLLNLLVCRQAGVFDNLDTLALRLRTMNEERGGWAPAPRQILDKQPPKATSRTKRYASLHSHAVIDKLAKSKGITTTVQVQASTPSKIVSKPRPQTLAQAPIREWARTLGLPGGATGPIRASVLAAYEASGRGASDAEARAIYQRHETERATKKQQRKNSTRTQVSDRRRTTDLAPIRAWAAANGYALPKHAQISPALMEAYQAAQSGVKHQRRPSQRPKKMDQ